MGGFDDGWLMDALSYKAFIVQILLWLLEFMIRSKFEHGIIKNLERV